MAATLGADNPIEKNGRFFYTVTLSATGDTVTFRPPVDFDYDKDPILADIDHGLGDIIVASYSQSPAASPPASSFITMSYGQIGRDITVIWDFYADNYRIAAQTGGGTTTIYVSSPVGLLVELT